MAGCGVSGLGMVGVVDGVEVGVVDGVGRVLGLVGDPTAIYRHG